MQGISFVKEFIVYSEKNVSLVLLSQKQFRPALSFALKDFLLEEGAGVALVSLTQPSESVAREFPEAKKENFWIIDAFSRKSDSYDEPNAKVVRVDSPSNLTGIQIAVEKALDAMKGKKVIIIDSLSALAIYNEKDTLGKFIHLFSNKIKLQNNTGAIFTVRDSTNAEALDITKQFCDKTYDFAELYISSIEMAQ